MRRSCQEIKENGHTSDGDYLIDPDGLGAGEEPIMVYCNMTAKNGLAGTHVNHDSEERTYVKGYERPLSYSKTFRYNMTMAQMIALTDLSGNCEQFIRYECRGSVLLYGTSTDYASWESREGKKMNYWGGASPGSRKCACGMTQSCNRAGYICNCDINDGAWRSDEGYLSDKGSLPVTKLYFGDTGGGGEAGYHTLGPLICYGTA